MRAGLLVLVSVFVGACSADATDGFDVTGGPDVGDTNLGDATPDATPDTPPDSTEVSLCADLVCNTPPAASCTSATTLRVWSTGTCTEPKGCEYAYRDETCAAGCSNGACKGDPCAGVTCTTPPSACHEAVGTCQNGVCSYADRIGAACDDGDPCTIDDICDNGCGGRLIACTSPPPDACEDATTLVVYSATGVCSGTACSYTSERVACADGCVDGACAGDPCAGVTCDTAPSACHVPLGTCVSGVCRYDFDDGAACTDGDACTSNDRCEAGICKGSDIACVTPPAPTCSDDILVVAAATGTCSEGTCSYDREAVSCDLGCDPGGSACSGDPCNGVTCTTPPAASCVGNVLHTFASGTCSGGSCNYVEATRTCPNGCAVTGCLAPPGTVISEVVYDAVGADDDVFVELHGTPGASLTGLTLVGLNGNGGADYQTITLSGTFDSGGLFVVADPNASTAITDVADQLASAADYQNGPDSIELRIGATVVDALGYGVFTAADVFKGEGHAHPGITAPGQSLARNGTYSDTNDNQNDFAVVTKPTPGAPNVAGPAPTYDAVIAISSGEGAGTVTSDFPGLGPCRSTCRVPYTGVHDVTFTATPDPGSVIGAWINEPQCGTSTTCEITLPGDDNRGAAVRFDLDPGWLSVAVGWEATYAVRADGTLWGWGNLHAATTPAPREEHRPVRIGNKTGWSIVSSYEDRVCGLMDRMLYCWGAGPIGDGTSEYRIDPVLLLPNTFWKALSVGGGHTCAVDTTSRMFCWGADSFGQSAVNSPRTPVLTPTQVKFTTAGSSNAVWEVVTTGGRHSCGATGSDVWCWGSSAAGQYEGAGFDQSASPIVDFGTPPEVELTSGETHLCRRRTQDGTIRCSGTNNRGQCGRNDAGTGANTLSWTQLDAGGDSTCGVSAGKLYCFGDAGEDGPIATQIGTRTDWASADVGGGLHQCALTEDGALYCWGDNTYGQLGDGTTTARTAADLVLVVP